MAVFNPLAGLFIASLINAVPSNEAYHPPRHYTCDLVEADLSGSGREAIVAGVAVRSIGRDDLQGGSGRYWRTMAQRCRSLAEWHTGYSREVLLQLAEEYEQRARRIERPADAEG